MRACSLFFGKAIGTSNNSFISNRFVPCVAVVVIFNSLQPFETNQYARNRGSTSGEATMAFTSWLKAIGMLEMLTGKV